jgi:8-oxo-dGTP diphosphatase
LERRASRRIILEGSFTQYQVRVSAIVYSERGQLLVVQHSRNGRPFWTFPGGAPNLGESLSDAVIREVREETGYAIEHGDVIAIGELGGNRWEPPRLEIIFRGTVNQAVPVTPRPSDELLKAQWRSMADIEHQFAPIGVLRAATAGQDGRYLGDITEDLGEHKNED